MIFYFTATGNSLYVAKQLDEERFSIPQEMNKINRHYVIADTRTEYAKVFKDMFINDPGIVTE